MVNIELIKTLKILYVEDEIALRDITTKSLNSIVKEIVVASNGKEGLDKFQLEKFDLIITDLAMPIMDGIEMMQHIREIDKDIPILVTTAFGSQNSEVSKLDKFGMSSYIMKPVDIMELIKAIDQLLIEKI